jgi:transcription elongation factor GreB
MTPKGFTRLQAELHEFLHVKRPEVTAVVAWAAGNGDRSENADYIYGKRRLREIDRRIHFLQKRLEQAEVVDPKSVKGEQVFFGATVTLVDEEGAEKSYSIVGIDEAEPGKGKISWISPLAKSLLKKSEGDVVKLRTPKGERELEIIEIRYTEID